MEHLGIGKVCPHCGGRSETLGSLCPACGKAYAPRGGLLDRLPFMNADGPTTRFGARAVFIVLMWIVIGWVWLFITHPVAGILLTAAAFIALVAAIGLANALDDRGR